MTERLRRLRDRVRGLEDQNRPASALLTVREILRHHPDDGNALMLEGRLLTTLLRYAEAEQSFQRALPHFTGEMAHAVYRELGHLYEAWGRLELALSQFEKVVELRPDHAAGHSHAGGILLRLGRFDEANAAHTRATRCVEGRVDEAYFKLGLALRATESFGEARAAFEQALDLDPHYGDAREALADVVAAQQAQAESDEKS